MISSQELIASKMRFTSKFGKSSKTAKEDLRELVRSVMAMDRYRGYCFVSP